MEAYVCDRCEKVITDKKVKSKMIILKLCTERVGIFDEMHLCDDCREKFYEFIENEKILESEK